MGREILRVPPDWQHPRYETQGQYQWQKPGVYRPMHMQPYSNILAEFAKCPEDFGGDEPSPYYYRQREWAPEEATAYQVYETVSEGSPVSPVLPTREALIAWLTSPIPRTERYPELSVQGMTLAQAERFVDAAWAPSMIFTPSSGLQMGAKAVP